MSVTQKLKRLTLSKWKLVTNICLCIIFIGSLVTIAELVLSAHSRRVFTRVLTITSSGSSLSLLGDKLDNTFHSRDTRTKSPRVLCWLLTDPKVYNKTFFVRDTWTKQCDKVLFFSSHSDPTLPAIGLGVPPDKDHISRKAKLAWSYIYTHHFDDAEFFVKADPDTYVLVNNLRRYLSTRDSEAPEFYGRRFFLKTQNVTYVSGGSGEVLTRHCLRQLVTVAFTLSPDCMPDGRGEDFKLAYCLSRVGCRPIDTRDEEGRETFMVFRPDFHFIGNYPDWFYDFDVDGAVKVKVTLLL
jgi:glycoprotein-N-acetylgalactosamine 3-beta-galactosyltransferase